MNAEDCELMRLVMEHGRVKHVEALAMLLAQKYGTGVVIPEMLRIDKEMRKAVAA